MLRRVVFFKQKLVDAYFFSVTKTVTAPEPPAAAVPLRSMLADRPGLTVGRILVAGLDGSIAAFFSIQTSRLNGHEMAGLQWAAMSMLSPGIKRQAAPDLLHG